MKKTSKNLKVKKVEYLDLYKLKLLFSDDFVQIIDFEIFLKQAHHPDIQKYLKPKYFKSYSLIDGELMWGDFDLIFPIMDLYHNSIVPHAS
ncbi:MAG: DUF2442 domain-containing protein [Pseudomonadota bacterium]